MGNPLTVSDIQRKVAVLGRRYGAERIFLFGSYAKGEADENSDIDLRIDRGDVRGLMMGGLQVDLEDSLGKKVDLISTKALRKDFLETIKKDEVLLYDRTRP